MLLKVEEILDWKMGEQTLDLPEECWEMILNLIEHYHFVSLSLVCKRFLAITNRLLSRLVVSDPTLLLLPQLLRRFPRLRIIDLAGFRGDVDALLSQIAKSGLDLEVLGVSNQKTLPVDGLRVVGSKMRNLRCLNCSKIGFLQDNDLGLIAETFPFLEELDISYPEHAFTYSSIGLLDSCVSARPITDSGILSLAVKLKGLKKINLSGNHFITDKSLGFLSRNCLLLNEILLHNCDFVTQNGILLVIRDCANLNSLSFSGIWSSFVDSRFKDSFVCTKSLCAVDFSDSVISDELLYSIAEACLPLNKLILSHCQNFTFSGISSLLCKHQSLQYLDLELANFLTDEYMLELSKFLRRITYLNLSLCHQLTNLTFFNLPRNCPLLNEFKMVGTNLGAEDSTTSFVVNPRVKSLNLARNSSLDNDTISMFASSCPNLKLLDLSCCFNITEEGISEVLKRCSEIRYLRIKRCSGIKTLVIDCELSSLEVLCAWESGIDDDGLAMIGNRCCRLLQLDLTDCSNVTAKGVKEVVQNCRVLRDINLKWCNNVDVDIIPWMVFSRPSLKRIVPPPGFVPSESQRNLFLRHGCLVCEG